MPDVLRRTAEFLASVMWRPVSAPVFRTCPDKAGIPVAYGHRSGVLCVRDCLSVLVDATVATAADDDSDLTPPQP